MNPNFGMDPDSWKDFGILPGRRSETGQEYPARLPENLRESLKSASIRVSSWVFATLLPLARDSKFLHAGSESRALHTQFCGRPVGTADHPIRFA
jgi:hypothetical protein